MSAVEVLQASCRTIRVDLPDPGCPASMQHSAPQSRMPPYSFAPKGKIAPADTPRPGTEPRLALRLVAQPLSRHLRIPGAQLVLKAERGLAERGRHHLEGHSQRQNFYGGFTIVCEPSPEQLRFIADIIRVYWRHWTTERVVRGGGLESLRQSLLAPRLHGTAGITGRCDALRTRQDASREETRRRAGSRLPPTGPPGFADGFGVRGRPSEGIASYTYTCGPAFPAAPGFGSSAVTGDIQ